MSVMALARWILTPSARPLSARALLLADCHVPPVVGSSAYRVARKQFRRGEKALIVLLSDLRVGILRFYQT